MNKRLFPLCIIVICVVGGLLSSKWFPSNEYNAIKDNDKTVKQNTNNIDANVNQFQDVLTIDELVKQYNNNGNSNNGTTSINNNTSNNLNPPVVQEPTATQNKDVTVETGNNNKMAVFQNMFFNVIGTNQIIQAEPYDGKLGSASLEIYNKSLKGFYKLRYLYSETSTMLTHSVELNYAVGSDSLSTNSFKLDEIHRTITGVSLEPYVVTQMNTCLENFRKVAQINATTATDTTKSQYQDFSSHNVQYRISTIGNIVTISGTISTNK